MNEKMETHFLEASAEDRLTTIRSRIETALIGTNRKLSDITLIAVSKGHPTEAIRGLYELGIRDFGESYAQEFSQKTHELAELKDIRWHFIGHLQSNKAKKLIVQRPLIHSLDRLSLLNELAKYTDPANPMRVLLQLQVDPSDVNKSGCARAEAEALCQRMTEIPGLLWEGFMGIGPADCAPERLRWHYEQFTSFARLLWEQFSLRDPSRQTREPRISLGMSDDLEIALRSGANTVRIGSHLFGPRPAKSQAT
jgi:pyridoxal phosphate enzyme (YggS family)